MKQKMKLNSIKIPLKLSIDKTTINKCQYCDKFGKIVDKVSHV